MTRNTIYNRSRALARLRRWAGRELLYLTEAELLTWQQERSKIIKPQSQRAELSNAREFYRWVVRERYRDDDPTARLLLPRVARGIPRPMSDDGFAAALDAAPQDVRVALALAGFAGLRAIEIARLDWAEVGIDQRTPAVRVVQGKGGHGRVVPIASALAKILLECNYRRGPVITYRSGLAGHVPAHRVSQLANDFLHEHGHPETLHQLRHRFATRAHDVSHDLRVVQELLGHASPTTTAIYAQVSGARSASVVEAAGELDLAAAA